MATQVRESFGPPWRAIASWSLCSWLPTLRRRATALSRASWVAFALEERRHNRVSELATFVGEELKVERLSTQRVRDLLVDRIRYPTELRLVDVVGEYEPDCVMWLLPGQRKRRSVDVCRRDPRIIGTRTMERPYDVWRELLFRFPDELDRLVPRLSRTSPLEERHDSVRTRAEMKPCALAIGRASGLQPAESLPNFARAVDPAHDQPAVAPMDGDGALASLEPDHSAVEAERRGHTTDQVRLEPASDARCATGWDVGDHSSSLRVSP